jgi:hypothetical protein
MGKFTKFIRTDGQSPDARSLVTLRRNTIAFNSHFIRANKLKDCSRVTVFCDAESYRVGLRFHSDISDYDSFALTADGGSAEGASGDGRASTIAALMKQHRWLLAAAIQTASVTRRYQPVWSSSEKLWVINVRPSFEMRVTSAKEIEPGLCGIYRYRSEDRIVYIGRGDIRGRASSSERAEWTFDSIEYSVIADASEQEKWETLWLDEYRNEFGTLPIYNRIGGKRSTESS